MCNCIDKVNKTLEILNTCLTIPLLVQLDTGEQRVGDRIMLSTEKIDPKKRGTAKKLFAAYCPICGEKYSQ
jgi:hypothetical protein